MAKKASQQRGGGRRSPVVESSGPPVEAFDAGETGLATVEASGEVARAASQSMAIAEIQASVLMAIKYPRNEDDCFGRLMKSCERPTFQEKCVYQFPRGDKQIIGPSVHLSREAARIWGNMRYGFYVMFENDESMQIRGYAWDLQTNQKIEQDAMFRKLIQRNKHGSTNWIIPDERDLRELVNKYGAIAERNCVLKLLPPYLVEDAMRYSAECQEKQVTDQPEEAKRQIIRAFATYNIQASQLEEYIGHSLREATPGDLVELRQIWASIRDGNTVWSEYTAAGRDGGGDPGNGKSHAPNAKGGVTMDDLTRPDPAAASREEAANREEAQRVLAEEEAKRKAQEAKDAQPIGRKDYIGPDEPPTEPEEKPKRSRGRSEPKPPATPFEEHLAKLNACTTAEHIDAVMGDADSDKRISAEEWEQLTSAEEELNSRLWPEEAASADLGQPPEPERPVWPQPQPTDHAKLPAWYQTAFANITTAEEYADLTDSLTSDDRLTDDAFNALQSASDAAAARLGIRGGEA